MDASPAEAALIIKDEFLFYTLNYLFFVIIGICAFPLLIDHFSSAIILLTLALCVIEGFSTLITAKLTSLGRPIMGNVVFFIRSSLWVFPFILFDQFYESYRSVEIILIFWTGGALLSLLFGVYLWRHFPWAAALKAKTQWLELLHKTKTALPLWIAGICLAGANYFDRFFVEFYLDRELVGVISYYGSFLIAVNALVGSGVFSFGYPKMISHYKSERIQEFLDLTKSTALQAFFVALFLSCLIGFAAPLLGDFIGRPELYDYRMVFYIMLIGGIIRVTSQSLEFYFYAKHIDWPVWSANFVLLTTSILSSVFLIPVYGLIGAGYSVVIGALCLAVWRLFCLYKTSL